MGNFHKLARRSVSTLGIIALFVAVIGGLATPALAADSDGDGMRDRWERLNGTNPNEPDAREDPDRDRLVNIAEYRHRTFPLVFDSDDDGLGDGVEVRRHETDPRKPDSDGDGSSDYWEVGIFDTDPNDVDSDGDGTLDGDEDSDSDGVDDEDENDQEGCQPDLERDRDNDNIANEDENDFGTDPSDEDSDDDGTVDGDEDANENGVADEDEDDFDVDECIARAEMQFALRNAATAQESYATTTGGMYTTDPADLYNEGLRVEEDVIISIPRADGLGYCIQADHEGFALVMHYSSDVGAPEEGPCA